MFIGKFNFSRVCSNVFSPAFNDLPPLQADKASTVKRPGRTSQHVKALAAQNSQLDAKTSAFADRNVKKRWAAPGPPPSSTSSSSPPSSRARARTRGAGSIAPVPEEDAELGGEEAIAAKAGNSKASVSAGMKRGISADPHLAKEKSPRRRSSKDRSEVSNAYFGFRWQGSYEHLQLVFLIIHSYDSCTLSIVP